MTEQQTLAADDPRRYLLTGEHIRAALELLFSPDWGRGAESLDMALDGAAILAGETNDNGGSVSDASDD